MKQGFPVCDVALPAWPGCTSVAAPVTVALPDGLTPIRPIPSQHKATRAFLPKCCNIMIALESDLNALDAKSGDGDTGSTLAGAARALILAMDHLPLADHTQPYRAIGLELSQTMGGSSGILHVGLGGAPPTDPAAAARWFRRAAADSGGFIWRSNSGMIRCRGASPTQKFIACPGYRTFSARFLGMFSFER